MNLYYTMNEQKISSEMLVINDQLIQTKRMVLIK